MSENENEGVKSEPGPRLVSTSGAARALGISERHLRTLAGKGYVRVVRLGRRCLIERESIDALISRGGTS